MRLRICAGSHRIALAVHQSRVKDPVRVRGVRLMKVLQFSKLVVDGNTFHDGPATTDANTAFRRAADTIKYHVHFVKERYSLPNGISYLPDFRSGFLQPPSTNQDDINATVDAVFGEYSAVEEASTEALAPRSKSDQPERRTSAALSQQAD